MDFFKQILDIFLHLDVHLAEITQQYGFWTYAILFVIIFIETGVVIMPFLPGDSLLFAAGALAALPDSGLNVFVLILVLFAAAFLGDTLNYTIGDRIGTRAFTGDIKFLRKDLLEKTRKFYEKHGNQTIILARFIPFARTFAPFVAGIGTMSYGKFISFNLIGGFLWVTAFTLAGYFFGQIPAVKHNFTLIIFGIIGISLIPPVWAFVRSRMKPSEA
jgi:membrane-associated protein